ncbi:uncharacterized mitochondrial protein AtMg00810-like [Malus sylvestris]|uniref:uncharacterized mitochondrial protein AtMg00810-like n=1 Tax=Malus sylvestris TaxID=3752 RepID=UPI0021AD037C|nr:uncharacterized mitochondrial protein AtMg00810-like [Malus sylvestris]
MPLLFSITNAIMGLTQLNWVQTTTTDVHLSQTKYAYDSLKRANMVDCKPCSTPVAAKTSLSANDGPLLSSPIEFQALVGCLQYLTLTQLDISFAVNNVAQFMASPHQPHLLAIKRILQYIKGSITHGLLLHSQPVHSRILTYSDVDWAGCVDTHRSTTGYLIYHGSNLLSWCSKKQPMVSKSSAKSKYRALSRACAETIWLSYMFSELGIATQFPIHLYCNNVNTTYMAANPVFHARTRHIELDYNFIRERVALGSHQVRFRPSVNQPADLLTKGLLKPRHLLLWFKLVHPLTPSFRGGCVKQESNIHYT